MGNMFFQRSAVVIIDRGITYDNDARRIGKPDEGFCSDKIRENITLVHHR